MQAEEKAPSPASPTCKWPCCTVLSDTLNTHQGRLLAGWLLSCSRRRARGTIVRAHLDAVRHLGIPDAARGVKPQLGPVLARGLLGRDVGHRRELVGERLLLPQPRLRQLRRKGLHHPHERIANASGDPGRTDGDLGGRGGGGRGRGRWRILTLRKKKTMNTKNNRQPAISCVRRPRACAHHTPAGRASGCPRYRWRRQRVVHLIRNQIHGDGLLDFIPRLAQDLHGKGKHAD